ncbi:Cytoplasmic axial filament protein CafA and Ribonuclease G [Marinobacterium lacunae]|uniref:Ribonuclease G n=1 Tax=Marinobacterium lacunae TaxID=1232683 RepID=A0A081FXL7_9GAMM|nr:ribonuclease G [Marinobacterium lacunae]KEA63272.1 Cytoplasmic axial filament protein CafA and Ribonuclease G [Marinobacterium lacunae]MBR9882839.1 ribonuclease G [Oceanospirillales bacterium]
MAEEILINFTPMETRVAVIENGMPQEIYIERAKRRGIVGNIYKGKVVRVLPGMQAAFVDIGLERAAFIHVDEVVDQSQSAEGRANLSIAHVLREGQSLLVQVTKDPIGTKGARLTTHLSIPSRYLVLMPGSSHIGVSQRIEDPEERERLRSLIQKLSTSEEEESPGHGFILRTVAEQVSEAELAADIQFLVRLWDSIQSRIAKASAPSAVYEDLPLNMRALRDMAHAGVERIRIDSRETFQKAVDFCRSLVPEIESKLEYYPGERPIFDLFNVEEEVQKALGRKVELKSGGYLIFDQTEAMTTVDVNTGAFVGHRNLEETIFKTNLEAATAIGRQLRLRNLGGIIIIDFIDMEDVDHQRQVLRTLERVLEKDYAKCKVTGVSELGLVEMTRKRTRESLEQVLCEPCQQCEGRGSIRTPETVCYEIFREILRQHRAYDTDSYLVLANQRVVDYLLDDASDHVAELEVFIGKTIRFQVEPMYNPEHFDVVLR